MTPGRDVSVRRRGRRPAGLAAVLLLAAGWLAATGCTREPADSAAERDAADGLAKSAAPAPGGSPKPDREAWYATYVLGAKVGYQHTAVSNTTRDGRPVVRTDSTSHIVMKRGVSRVVLDVRFSDTATPEGNLLDFEAEIAQGGTSIASRGRVVGGQLEVTTTTLGKSETSSIPWPAECGGFNAVEQSLARNPMKPAEERTLRALLPIFNQLGTIELLARKTEQVKLLTGTYELLRIESSTAYPGGHVIRDTIWTDRTGLPMKMYSQAMDSELYCTTREIAQDKEGLGRIDFNLDVAVGVDRPLPSPHATKKVRYRITLDRGDPAAAFVSGPTQQVRSIDAHTAEVTVYALRPGQPPGNSAAADDPSGEDDRQPNNLIQSDNPEIVALARKAVGQEKDPWAKAVALEGFVRGHVTQKNFSTAFASAAEVAQSREGDCTEHAVLLAALARASGIPSRVAIGLVYQDGKFYFHMWDEVCIDKGWVPIDSTLAQGGIGAAHLKLAHSSLKGSSAFSAFLPVANVLGRGLKIEIVEAQ
jgi:hypothetical protein